MRGSFAVWIAAGVAVVSAVTFVVLRDAASPARPGASSTPQWVASSAPPPDASSASRPGASSASRPDAFAPSAKPVAPSPLDVLRGSASVNGFARADTARTFEFPRDHGPHPAFRHEWWYFTGHLQATDGERFGFELTFFRVAFVPPQARAPPQALAQVRVPAQAQAAEQAQALAQAQVPAQPQARDAETSKPLASRWRTRQIFLAHFAITDIDRRTFHSTQRLARDALELAGAKSAPFRVWLGDWFAGAQDAVQAGHADDWALHAGDASYALTLQLQALGPPVLNGNRGLSIKSDEPGAASYYYSIPRLAARGQLARGSQVGRTQASGSRASGSRASGSQVLDVTGTAWLDREWGSGSLGPRQEGWDWFALQLGNGDALMFYLLRDEGGARDLHSAGTWIAADGSTRALTSGDVRIDVLDHWTSPHGTRYPSRWRLRIDSLGLDVTASPVLPNQELDTTPRYWEGDVQVTGSRAGKPLSGQGYVELVGYGGR